MSNSAYILKKYKSSYLILEKIYYYADSDIHVGNLIPNI